MGRWLFVSWSLAAFLGVAVSAGQAPASIDAAFTAFLQADTQRDATAASERVLAKFVSLFRAGGNSRCKN